MTTLIEIWNKHGEGIRVQSKDPTFCETPFVLTKKQGYDTFIVRYDGITKEMAVISSPLLDNFKVLPNEDNQQ